MQANLPISKPLALVIIGLVIGASLGLGSGYAVFYPNMVNQRSQTIEERVEQVEANVTIIEVKLDSLNRSISAIGDSLEGILTLTDVLQQVSSRVSALENGQVTLNSELDDIENTLEQLNKEFVTLTDAWDTTRNTFQDLETAYYAANNELESVQALVRENNGIRIFTGYMANPSSGYKEDITDEIYATLILENVDFSDWVNLVGETSAKVQLLKEVDSLLGELVWNPTENIEVGADSYQVKLESYFRLEFSPADVSVNKMHIAVKATINIETESITLKDVSLVEII